MSQSSSPYIPTKNVNASYRPKGYGLSPGLKRARAQYRFRNALTGFIVGSFAVGVWAYSISAVKQDAFDDADEEAKALLGAQRTSLAGEQEMKNVAGASPSTAVTGGPLVQSSASPAMHSGLPNAKSELGVLGPLIDRHFPRFLDPSQKTLVWGAPPVDRIGHVGDIVKPRE